MSWVPAVAPHVTVLLITLDWEINISLWFLSYDVFCWFQEAVVSFLVHPPDVSNSWGCDSWDKEQTATVGHIGANVRVTGCYYSRISQGYDFTGYSISSLLAYLAPTMWVSLLDTLLGLHGPCILGNMCNIMKATVSIWFRQPNVYCATLKTNHSQGLILLDE